MSVPPPPPATGPAPVPPLVGGPPQPAPAPDPAAQPAPDAGSHQPDMTAPEPPSDSVGAGTSAAEATARSGQGSKRKGLLREASFRVKGDHVEGDKIVITAGQDRGVTLRTLPPAAVHAARHYFQDPPRWEAIRTDAWRRRSVVLRGPDGSGRTTAAVRLLLEEPVNSWYLLDSVADLSRLTSLDQLGSGTALLLNRPRDISDLHGPLLEGLEDLLERAKARLVLIVGPDAALDRGLGEYVLALTGPPSLERVFTVHLTARMQDAGAAEVLAADGVRELVARLLEPPAGCDYAARLAEVLATEHGAGRIDLARVRTRMDQYGGEDPETWFEGLSSDPVLCTQAIALAALNGLPQEEVALAASSLLARFGNDRLLLTGPNEGPAPAARNPFTVSARAQLERLRARTVTTVARGQFGRMPCTVMEYRDAGYPRRVLRHVWSEYQIQPELVDWLGELVGSASEQVRGFAGTALGLIAVDAFDHLATQVFPGWIMHEERGALRREAVGYALRVCVEDPALRPGVRAMVDGWYLSPAWQAKAAAARAYGLCLGGADLRTAVDALVRLGTVDHIRIAIAIGDSFADLVEDDVEQNAEVVLAAIARMIDEHESRASGHLAFLIIADALVTQESQQTAGAAGRSWPTLLWLHTGPERVRRQLVHLWSEVINGELFGDEAADVLASWAAQAERDPLLLSGLQGMLSDLASVDQETRRLLLFYVSRWEAPESLRPLNRAARVIRAVLDH